MADSVKIRGRLYHSWHQSELEKQEGETDYANEGGIYGVLFIDGDKSKLFHFRWSNDVVLKIGRISNLPLKNFCEVEFNSNAKFMYSSDGGQQWLSARFDSYSKVFVDSNLKDDASVTGHTEGRGSFIRPMYDTRSLDNPFLEEDD